MKVGETLRIQVQHRFKDGKWTALVEPPAGEPFIVEEVNLGMLFAVVQQRLEGYK